MAEPKTYEDLMIEKYLKESIVRQAQALYGMNYPSAHNWSVIVAKSKLAQGPARATSSAYRAHIVAYISPKKLSEWTPLESTTHLQATEKEALQSLLDDLQEGLAKLFEREYTYDSEAETAVGDDTREEHMAKSGKHKHMGERDQSEGFLVDVEEDQYAEEQRIDDDSDETYGFGSEMEYACNDRQDESEPLMDGHPVAAEKDQETGEETIRDKSDKVRGGEDEDSNADSDDRNRTPLIKAERQCSIDDERVEDLVCESDREPSSKRRKLERRKAFEGSYAVTI